MKGALAKNIKIIEFYFAAGEFKRKALEQQSYMLANYTHVSRDVVARGLMLFVSKYVR